MTLIRTTPTTIAPPMTGAKYSHSVEVPPHARWLYISGQLGARRTVEQCDGVAGCHRPRFYWTITRGRRGLADYLGEQARGSAIPLMLS